MLKEILDIFRSHSSLEEIESELLKMVQIAEEMFVKVTEPLEVGEVTEELKNYVWERDEEINKWEQRIRRRLYMHLVVGECATADLSMVTAVLSVVRDAERLGDFVKNIYRVQEANPKKENPEALEIILRLRHHIVKQFGNIQSVLKTNDEKRAKEIVDLSKKDQAYCDDLLTSIIKGSTELIDSSNPVACALLLRYFKRVLSHQIKIATSVYLPIDSLDITDEPA